MRAQTKKDLKIFGACLIGYAVVEGLMEAGIIGAFWQLTLVSVGIYIILAASLNLINGFTGQFSIGHAGFMAIGAYGSAICTMKLHIPFLAAVFIGALAAGLLGFLIGLPTLRLRGDYLAIATLGLGEIIRNCVFNIAYVGGASGFMDIHRYTSFTWMFIFVIITLFFIKNLVNSTHGRACIAVRENEIAAEAMGVNTTKYKVLAFTIGAFFTGLAGGLFMGVCERIYVLDYGRIIAQGTPQAIRTNPQVIEAYLGKEADGC